MTLKGGGDIINSTDEIEIRCPGIYKDKNGEWPCKHMFCLGSPGFDLHGNSKTQIIKCPKCKNYFTVTTEIEEKVIIKLLEKK